MNETNKKLLSSLLGKQSPEQLTSEELSRKAHYRWDRKQYLEAAVLFEAAAARCAEEVRLEPPPRDNTFVYRVRSGVLYRMAGEVEIAWPILLEATTFDWQAAGIPEDDHFTEWAYVEMLCVHAATQNKQEYLQLFWQAVTQSRSSGGTFPRIHPKQELLLDHCEYLGLVKELTHVIERIEARKISRPLKQRLKQLKAAHGIAP